MSSKIHRWEGLQWKRGVAFCIHEWLKKGCGISVLRKDPGETWPMRDWLRLWFLETGMNRVHSDDKFPHRINMILWSFPLLFVGEVWRRCVQLVGLCVHPGEDVMQTCFPLITEDYKCLFGYHQIMILNISFIKRLLLMSVVSVCFLVPSESEKSENYLMNYKVTLVLKCK